MPAMYYTLKEIAATLGVKYKTLWQMLRRNRIPGVCWKNIGPGCTGAAYSEEEYQTIAAWQSRRPLRIRRSLTNA